jgi:hypothetical protein
MSCGVNILQGGHLQEQARRLLRTSDKEHCEEVLMPIYLFLGAH